MALPQVALPTYELTVPSSGKKLKYRPFVVKEEKLLLLALESGDDKEIERAVKTLLKGCIQTRVKVEEFPIFDLEYIFLQIRAVSVGEVVEMNVICKDETKRKLGTISILQRFKFTSQKVILTKLNFLKLWELS